MEYSEGLAPMMDDYARDVLEINRREHMIHI